MKGQTAVHVVWDWNGTLIDDTAATWQAVCANLVALGGEPISLDSFRLFDGWPSWIGFYTRMLGRDVSVNEYIRISDQWLTHYLPLLPSCPLTVDAVDALDAWTGTQSLLSMLHHDNLVAECDRRSLTDRFLHVQGRTDLRVQSKTQALLDHLATLQIEPVDVVLIGDTLGDVRAARFAGARCVLYSGGLTHPCRLADLDVPVADTLVDAIKLAAA